MRVVKNGIDNNIHFKCVCCAVVYQTQKNNFLTTKSRLYVGNNGYLTICKNCADDYYRQLVGFYDGDINKAIEHCARKFDWYFDEKIVGATANVMAPTTRLSAYPSRARMAQFKSKTDYLDTVREKQSEVVVPFENAENDETGDLVNNEYSPTREIIRAFGNGFTNDEYEYLDMQFNDWCQRYDISMKADEELIRAICVAQLSIRQTREIKELEKAMRTFQDLIKTADLKPNRSATAAASDDTFGTLIRKLENERPVCEPDPEWADVDGVKKMLETFFLGHMCNLLDIHNDFEAQYLEEMEKYTVKPPKVEEMFGDGETSIFDRFTKTKSEVDGDE